MSSTQLADSERAALDVTADDPGARIVMALGRGFHQAGVPSDQLEELMYRVAAALDIDLQVTVLPTSITAAIGPSWSQRVVLLRLEPGAIDLERLALLNRCYDRVVAKTLPLESACREVERIESLSHDIAPPLRILAFCLISGAAAIVLGGRPLEIAASALIGIAVGVVAVAGARLPAVDRLFNVIAAFIATAGTAWYSAHVHQLAVYVPIVAGVVQLVPGLQLTSALHELAYRNLVAGTARLGSVFMTLLSLGCGFALALGVVGTQTMRLSPIPYAPTPLWALALAVAGIATSIAILQRARARDYVWVYGSCAIAELAFRTVAVSPSHAIASFVGAFAVGCCANLAVRSTRVPQALLLVPGLLILVPGSLSYESVLFLLQSNSSDGSAIAINSVVAAVQLVAGLLLAQLVVAPNRRGAPR